MLMHNPSHPGATLREDVLPALGLSVTDAAQALGVTRVALSRVLNERAAISPEMALRIEKWLGPENGGEASVWVAQQAAYDLWHARKAAAAKIRQVKRAKIAKPLSGEHAAARSRT
jgi:addiction module HigA family antidote